ncbi:MAG: aminotransferase class III-fold pyridoxal phosphate-dependent enzyme [Myxococcota bacterium]|nr:aminotransferase class III-fold pyridoxal phosphate-dependent enzyme [Myxococcota bacterium]
MTEKNPEAQFDKAREELIARTPGSAQASARAANALAMEVAQTVVMPHPIYIERADGGRLTDVDGNVYIDLTAGFGPNVLGNKPEPVQRALAEQIERGWHWGIHNPLQADLAELICEASACADTVAFSNSGTEATMYATRLARAHTGKEKVALFDGSYHGVHDYALTKADAKSPRSEPTAVTLGGGVPGLIPRDTMLMLPYRDENAFELIRRNRDDLAVVLVEPVQSSNPRLDNRDFLGELIEVGRENEVLVLFDEVITGFRIEYGGCQEYYGLTPDLATYGKAIGGGMPIGAVGGRADIMNGFTGKDNAPYIFAAGTFSGNPLTMAAGTAAVRCMRDQRETLYPYLHEQGARFQSAVNTFCADEGIPAQVMTAGSFFHLIFQSGEIGGQRDIGNENRRAERQFYLHLLNNGVIIPGIHIAFFSAAHTPEDIDQVFDAVRASFLALREDGVI